MGASGKTEELAIKTYEAAKKAKLTAGKDTCGMSAACIYIASVLTGERQIQRNIAELAQVTEVTVRNRYKELVRGKEGVHKGLQFVVYL